MSSNVADIVSKHVGHDVEIMNRSIMMIALVCKTCNNERLLDWSTAPRSNRKGVERKPVQIIRKGQPL